MAAVYGAHPQLNAELHLHRKGNDKQLLIDLSDPAMQGALIIDRPPFGQCDGLTATVKDRAGQVITTTGPIAARFAKAWTGWFEDEICDTQSPDGSWPIPGGRGIGPQNEESKTGAVYRTSLRILMLEGFYRYMPTTQG